MRFAPTIALLLLAAPARAEERGRVSLALDGTGAPRTRAVTVTQLGPRVDADVRVARAVSLTLDAALATTSYRAGAEARRGTVTRLSNVLVGGRLRLVVAETTLDVGLVVGAPLVTVPGGGITESAAAEGADRAALGAAGPRGAFRWARNAVPVVGLVRASHALGPLRGTVDVEPGLLVSVNRDASRAAVVASAELALPGAVTPYVSLSIFASTRPLDANDAAQTGAALGARWELGTAFGWAEGRMQLDGPAGVTQRYATWWGGTIGAGVRF